MASKHQILDQAKLTAAQIGFSTMFSERLRVAAPDPAMELFMRIPTQNPQEQIKFLGDLPFLRKWVDDRHSAKLQAHSVTVDVDDHSAGVRVDLNDILDDRLGLIMPHVMQLADRARQYISDWGVRTLLNGFAATNFPETGNGLAYDSLLFFSASHQQGEGSTQSNLQSGALTAANYNASRAALLSVLDEQSQPFSLNPMFLLVGPSNERTARELVQAEYIPQSSAGVTNVFRGTANVAVSPRLTGSFANYWFLADTSQPIRPLVWIDRSAPQFDANATMSSDSVYERREAKFGTSVRFGAGYGLWQLIRGSTGA